MSSDLYKLTASEVSTKIKAGDISVEEYAKSLLTRIEARDEAVQAWAYLDPEIVIKQAKALDAVPKADRGPLHGVAIAVKDVIYTKGPLNQNENDNKSHCIQADRLFRYAHTVQLPHIYRRRAQSRCRINSDSPQSWGSHLRQNHNNRVRSHNVWPKDTQPSRPKPHPRRLIIWIRRRCGRLPSTHWSRHANRWQHYPSWFVQWHLRIETYLELDYARRAKNILLNFGHAWSLRAECS